MQSHIVWISRIIMVTIKMFFEPTTGESITKQTPSLTPMPAGAKNARKPATYAMQLIPTIVGIIEKGSETTPETIVDTPNK